MWSSLCELRFFFFMWAVWKLHPLARTDKFCWKFPQLNTMGSLLKRPLSANEHRHIYTRHIYRHTQAHKHICTYKWALMPMLEETFSTSYHSMCACQRNLHCMMASKVGWMETLLLLLLMVRLRLFMFAKIYTRVERGNITWGCGCAAEIT